MLSVYTKCCEVLLEVFQTDNNETQRISVEEYLNTQSNIKSDYCVQCKQWITVNERQQHINDNMFQIYYKTLIHVHIYLNS